MRHSGMICTNFLAKFARLVVIVAAVTFALVNAEAQRFAYVTNTSFGGPGNLAIIDTLKNTQQNIDLPGEGAPVSLGVTPNGQFIYVVSRGSKVVDVLNTATNTIQEISLPSTAVSPEGFAFTPDARFAYVTDRGTDAPDNPGRQVFVIETKTNTVVNTIQLPSKTKPQGIAIAQIPSLGRTLAFVADVNTELDSQNRLTAAKVYVIDTVTQTLLMNGSSPLTIPVGLLPQEVAITPDGSEVYVTNKTTKNYIVTPNVSVIKAATIFDTQPTVMSITLGDGTTPVLRGVAITPVTSVTPDPLAFVPDQATPAVWVINTKTNEVIQEITDGNLPYPFEVGLSPDGLLAYVTNKDPNNNVAGTVTPIDVQTFTAKSPLTDMLDHQTPFAVVVPQFPFCTPSINPTIDGNPLGIVVNSNCVEPQNLIQTQTVDWGDGDIQSLVSPTTTHSYSSSQSFPVTVKVTATDMDGRKCTKSQAITLNTQSPQVQQGQQAQANVQIAPGPQAQNIPFTFTCSTPPAGTKCSFEPATATLTNSDDGVLTTQITIATSGPAALTQVPEGRNVFVWATWLPLTAFFIFGFASVGKVNRRTRVMLCVLGLTVIALMFFVACGGSFQAPPALTPRFACGEQRVMVKATPPQILDPANTSGFTQTSLIVPFTVEGCQ